ASWLSQIQASISASEYEIKSPEPAGAAGSPAFPQAANRAQSFRTYFTDDGIQVVPRTRDASAWDWGLALVRSGRPNDLHAVDPASLSFRGTRGERVRDAIFEWYLNEPQGLEHGFTLAARPAHAGQDVFIDLALTGTLDPIFSTD